MFTLIFRKFLGIDTPTICLFIWGVTLAIKGVDYFCYWVPDISNPAKKNDVFERSTTVRMRFDHLFPVSFFVSPMMI